MWIVERKEVKGDLKKLQKKCADMTVTIKKLQSNQAKLTKLNRKLQAEVVKLKSMLKEKRRLQNRLKKRLYNTKTALLKTRYNTDTNGDSSLQLLRQCNNKQASLIKELQADLHARDENCAVLEERFTELERKLKPSIPNTKEGQKYSNNIRVLLLASQINPGQIEHCIRAVLDTFCPHIDSQLVELPKKSLTMRMRSSELLTINHAQQASILASSTVNVLSSDGTTLNQRKVQGTRLGGLTLGVEPVADGSAKSLITQLDKTLTTIREVGSEIEVADHNRIGWNLITTIMSDQASSQKAFNRMAREKMEEERGGEDSMLNEVYCGMHVGVNLRAAEIRGLKQIHQ